MVDQTPSTLTVFECGSEMARHADLTKRLNLDI